jgi:hypothetical protein
VSNQGKNVSIRKIINAIGNGERDPVKLCQPVHGRITNRHGKGTVTSAPTGVITDTDVKMLKMCMEEIKLQEKQQAACLTSLEELATKYYAGEISLPCTIPGIQKTSTIYILAEIGGDMSSFRQGVTFGRPGRAGLSPRNDESAGKIQSCKTLHGNRYLRTMPVEASWAATRSDRSFPGKKYNHLSKRMKSQKALLAIQRLSIGSLNFNFKTSTGFIPEKVFCAPCMKLKASWSYENLDLLRNTLFVVLEAIQNRLNFAPVLKTNFKFYRYEKSKGFMDFIGGSGYLCQCLRTGKDAGSSLHSKRQICNAIVAEVDR